MNGPESLLRLDGRVALVAGGSGGIGRATTRLLLAAGAAAESLDLPGSEVEPGAGRLDCDVRDPAAIEAAVARLMERHGRLDVLVHAAGIARDGVLWKLDDASWNAVLDVNLTSAFHLLRHSAPLLRARGRGSVVLISSINGERGKFGQANYAASKAGLLGLMRSAARELGGFGVRVNAIAPGLIATPMTAALPADIVARAVAETALGRVGEAEDVARAVLFLASDLARHVTGQVLRVDGGQLMA